MMTKCKYVDFCNIDIMMAKPFEKYILYEFVRVIGNIFFFKKKTVFIRIESFENTCIGKHLQTLNLIELE